MDLMPYFKLMVEKSASDLFITVGSPIKIKIEGKANPVGKTVLDSALAKAAAFGIMNEGHVMPSEAHVCGKRGAYPRFFFAHEEFSQLIDAGFVLGLVADHLVIAILFRQIVTVIVQRSGKIYVIGKIFCFTIFFRRKIYFSIFKMIN